MALQNRRHARNILATCAVVLLGLAAGLVEEGELPIEPDFQRYVGKFCYDYLAPPPGATTTPHPEGAADPAALGPAVGELRVETYREGPPPAARRGHLYFMIFDDERRRWKTARKRWATSTCEEKKKQASLVTEIDFSSERGESTYIIRIREKIRPRFWYFTFVACDSSLDAPMRYKVHATNDLIPWEREFSLDHRGMLRLFGLAVLGNLVLLLATVWATRWRQAARDSHMKHHPLIQLLCLACVASSASCCFYLLHYVTFQYDGYGSQRIRFLGVLGSIVAHCTVFLVAILASVGWSITTHCLPYRRYFFSAVAAVGFLAAVCELHSELRLDQSTKLYSYESPAGMLVLILKVLMFCWFGYHMKMTYEDETDHRRKLFYSAFSLSFAVWSLNVPLTVLLAFSVSPWYRYKVVMSADIILRFFGQALLTLLFCGSLSPVSKDNTFRPVDDVSIEVAFDQMHDDGNCDDL